MDNNNNTRKEKTNLLSTIYQNCLKKPVQSLYHTFLEPTKADDQIWQRTGYNKRISVCYYALGAAALVYIAGHSEKGFNTVGNGLGYVSTQIASPWKKAEVVQAPSAPDTITIRNCYELSDTLKQTGTYSGLIAQGKAKPDIALIDTMWSHRKELANAYALLHPAPPSTAGKGGQKAETTTATVPKVKSGNKFNLKGFLKEEVGTAASNAAK